jgi:hypothetical protein
MTMNGRKQLKQRTATYTSSQTQTHGIQRRNIKKHLPQLVLGTDLMKPVLKNDLALHRFA